MDLTRHGARTPWEPDQEPGDSLFCSRIATRRRPHTCRKEDWCARTGVGGTESRHVGPLLSEAPLIFTRVSTTAYRNRHSASTELVIVSTTTTTTTTTTTLAPIPLPTTTTTTTTYLESREGNFMVSTTDLPSRRRGCDGISSLELYYSSRSQDTERVDLDREQCAKSQGD